MAINSTLARAWLAWRPPTDSSLSDWADRRRVLSDECSAEPGPWDSSRFMPMKAIMDTVSKHEFVDYWLKTSTQTGKTEVLMNLILKAIDTNPVPTMLLMPREEDAKDFQIERLRPTLAVMPEVEAKIISDRLLHLQYEGSFLKLSGANSPASLASRALGLLLADEIDKYPANAGGQGDPVKQAHKRTRTYGNDALRFHCSSPTMSWDEQTQTGSRIHLGWLGSTMNRWNLPCYECGNLAPLSFDDIRWQRRKPETAKWVCPECSAEIKDSEKNEWVAKGEFIAEKPDATECGWHLWSGLSPWTTWAELAEDWLRSQASPELLQVFFNCELGEVWEGKGERLDAAMLSARPVQDEYTADCLPAEALVVVGSVDTQDDRLEFYDAAWGMGEKHWGLRHIIIKGDPGRGEVWAALDEILQSEYKTADGRTLKLSAVGIDSGGHYTDQVYTWARSHPRKVFCLKGSTNLDAPIAGGTTPPDSSRRVPRPRLYWAGTHQSKNEIAKRLRNITDPSSEGFLAWHSGFTNEWFDGLASEEKVRRLYKGRINYVWHSIRARNEPWDLVRYNLVVLRLLRPPWAQLASRAKIAQQSMPKLKNPQKKIEINKEEVIIEDKKRKIQPMTAKQMHKFTRQRWLK